MSFERFSQLLASVTMYRLLIYILSALILIALVLSAVGIVPADPIDILLETALLLALTIAGSEFTGYVLRVKPHHESSIITALILSLILGPEPISTGWPIYAVASLAATASKYVFAWKKKHIFNPAAIGALAAALIVGAPASWWVGVTALAIPTYLGGLMLMRRIRRFHLAFAFAGAYFGLTVADVLVLQGISINGALDHILLLATATPLPFFIFIMLPEPLTSPRTVRGRMWYGALIGAVLFAMRKIFPHVGFSIELALVVGNIFSRITSKDATHELTLVKKESLAPSIQGFFFHPATPISFVSGQFLEYTLPHASSDSRGERRYFTIASSPGERDILIATRFSEKGSSFKRALNAMSIGDTITSSGVAGEFVLPRDKSEKLLFIAGGIGITPYRSMVKHLLDVNEKRDIVLIYAARSRDDLVFRNLFDDAKKIGLKNMYVLSDESIPSDWKGERGLVDASLIKRLVSDYSERRVYVSGPEPMVEALGKTLRGMGIAEKRIVEDFFPGYTSL